MEENNNPGQDALSNDEAVEAVYKYAASLLIQEKLSPPDVVDSLVKQGIDHESAGIIVSNLEGQVDAARKRRARKDMLYGGLWCGGGLLVTFITMSAASGGGSYVVAWGAIVFGAIQFFRGLANN